MKILVVGSGGREHALVWKIAEDKRVKKIYAAPGNGGTASLAKAADIRADDIKGLLDFAKKKKIDLTVIGPESPLVKGIVDEFEKEGLRVFGAGREAARLEGSKVFAKEFMRRMNIPTADFEVFGDKEKALDFANSKNSPLVVKADGLAFGKGVFVCKTKEEAADAVNNIMAKRIFKDAGNKVIIEDRLEGEEASVIVLSDGENIAPLASSQDHKRIFDGDNGPNTGGMGAYSPAPVVEEGLFGDIIGRVVYPVIRGMKKEHSPYKGVLYAGIMITDKGPYVLEFNARFGDPETQAILPRMRGSLVDLIERAIDGRLKDAENEWDERSCACVVVASGGYPGDYAKGKLISGLKDAAAMKDIVVFHAGTKKQNSGYVTDGGRVLNVTALGDSIKDAVERSYEAVRKINFEGMHYRKDIGRRALKYVKH